MKLIIDFPDKNRRDIYWSNGKRVANLIGEYKVLAVLPEGHGDLISRLELKKAFEHLASDDYNDPLWYENTVFRVINTAPTVIEADKENGNG